VTAADAGWAWDDNHMLRKVVKS